MERGTGKGRRAGACPRPARAGRAVLWLAAAMLALVTGTALAQGSGDAGSASKPQAHYSRQGADTCLRCHDSDKVQSIFYTPHAEKADSRTPFAGLQCEACHGPAGNHPRRLMPGQKRPLIFTFGKNSPFPVAKQNARCLACHQDQMGSGWHGGIHSQAGVACADCHTIHARHDPVLSKATQPQVCERCHTNVRSQFQRAFSHPVRFGELGCTDCHKPHQSQNPFLLAQPTLNQTCYSCHADKRGPFLWEHPPAAENCADCHNPHGSNHRFLLTKSTPLLCQDCHSAAGHPSVARTGMGLPGNSPSTYLLGESCTNCHTKVHGSNNPSGAYLLR